MTSAASSLKAGMRTGSRRRGWISHSCRITIRARKKAYCAACISRIQVRKASLCAWLAAPYSTSRWTCVDPRQLSANGWEWNCRRRTNGCFGYRRDLPMASSRWRTTPIFFTNAMRHTHRQNEHSLAWDDPAVGIEWPIEGLDMQLSAKDREGKPLEQSGNFRVKVLITGSTGQLGRALIASAPADTALVPVDKDDCDLTDGDCLRSLLQREAPDLVINAAGYTAVDKAEEEEDKAARNQCRRRRHAGRCARGQDRTCLHRFRF